MEFRQANFESMSSARRWAALACLFLVAAAISAGGTYPGAPNLTAEGAKNKGIAFQIAHLKCPSCVNPGSPMPSFAGLGNARLAQIAAFLEASKGPKH